MLPSPTSPREEQIDTERKLLAALCQGAVTAETRAAILRGLNAHSFAEPDYHVVYRALATMPPMSASDTKQGLTQAVTRMGFPDVDLRGLFEGSCPTPEEVSALIAHL